MDRAMDDASEALLHDDEENLPDAVPKHVAEAAQAEQQKPQPHGRHRADDWSASRRTTWSTEPRRSV